MEFKKIVLILVLCLVSFCICSCDEDEKTELEILVEHLKEAYPDEKFFDDGWYEFSSIQNYYSNIDGNIDNTCIKKKNFKGYLDFYDKHGSSAYSNSYIYQINTIETKMNEISVYSNAKAVFNNNKYYEEYTTEENGEVTNRTYGNENFDFPAMVEHRMLSLNMCFNLEFLKKLDTVETIEFIDASHSEIKVGYLIISEFITHGYLTVRDEYRYYFDSNYKITMTTLLTHIVYDKQYKTYDPLKHFDSIKFSEFRIIDEFEIVVSENYLEEVILTPLELWVSL